MKKALFLSFFLLSSSHFFGEDTSFNCDPKKFLADDVLEKFCCIESAFNICLDCEDQSCRFKAALLSDEKSLSICVVRHFFSKFEIPPKRPEVKVFLATSTLFQRKVRLKT